MAVIKTNEWGEEENAKPPDPQMFGFQDIASDYYQVLIEKERPKPCKIAWGVIICTIFGFTVYMVFQLLRSYFQFNSFNVSTIEWARNVSFPAVTICSANSVNYTELSAALGEDLNADLQNLMYSVKMWDGVGRIQNSIDTTDFKELSAFEKKYGPISHDFSTNFKDYITFEGYSYTFQEVHKKFRNFKDNVYPTELGKCFEFNDDEELVQNIRGVPGGFTIDLDSHIDSYMTSTSTKGFYVFIRDQDETIMLNQGGYIISPGRETFMKLQENVMGRLGRPHGTCQNTANPYTKYTEEDTPLDHVHYMTVRECVQVKKIELMVSACECIPWYVAERLEGLNRTYELNKLHAKLNNGTWYGETTVPVINTTVVTTNYTSKDICNFVNQSICEAIVSNILRQPDSSKRMGDCHEPCSYREWEVELTSTQFPPTERYYGRYLSFKSKPGSKKFTFDYVRKNMARLHIYYDDIKVTKVTQTKAYQIQNFIAEFGGTVDLFIGFSFFTVFQLLEIAIAACFWKCCGKRTEDNPQDSAVIEKNPV